MMVRRVLLAAAVGVLSAALVGCVQMSGGLPSQGDVAATEASGEPQAVTHAVVGEKLSSGPWTVTVEEAKRSGDSVGGARPSSGHQLYLVEVGFENKGTESLVVNPDDFALKDGAGKAMPRAKTSKAAYNAQSMRPLNGRFGTSTEFVFEVPASAEGLTFVFVPPGSGKTSLEWKVP